MNPNKYDYETKAKVEIRYKKKFVIILYEIRNTLFNFYLDFNTIVELHKDSVLNEYSNYSTSINQTIDEIETYRSMKKSPSEKTTIELEILSVYRRIRVTENLYSRRIYIAYC